MPGLRERLKVWYGLYEKLSQSLHALWEHYFQPVAAYKSININNE